MAESYDSDGDGPRVGGAAAGADLFALLGLSVGILVVALGSSGYLDLGTKRPVQPPVLRRTRDKSHLPRGWAGR